MIIDAHTHLWKKQNGLVDGRPVIALSNGKSNFGGEIRQMMPPFMLSGENTVEMLISNMDYAGVNGAVITQEEIDGIKICAGRVPTKDLTRHYNLFETADKNDMFVSIDMADGDLQTKSLLEMIQQFPNLRIAIGHFGMVTRDKWTEHGYYRQRTVIMN